MASDHLSAIPSGNELRPAQYQAPTKTNADVLLIGSLG